MKTLLIGLLALMSVSALAKDGRILFWGGSMWPEPIFETFYKPVLQSRGYEVVYMRHYIEWELQGKVEQGDLMISLGLNQQGSECITKLTSWKFKKLSYGQSRNLDGGFDYYFKASESDLSIVHNSYVRNKHLKRVKEIKNTIEEYIDDEYRDKDGNYAMMYVLNAQDIATNLHLRCLKATLQNLNSLPMNL